MQIIDLGKLRFHFAGDFSASTQYEQNDIVKYGGNIYVYTYALKSSGTIPTDASHWALMVEGFKFKGTFETDVAYKVGDGVAHGSVVYIAIADSYDVTPPNPTYWSRFVDGIQYEGEYSNTGVYQKNDVVVYGGSIFIAKQDTTNHIPTNTTFWDKFVEGVSPQGIYNEATAYVPNDLVAYGANIYRAKVETTGHSPSDISYWEMYVGGIKFWGFYDPTKEYYVNDLVIFGNTVYRSRETQIGVVPTDESGWELLAGGTAYVGDFNISTQYYINDIVVYGNNSYRSKTTQKGVVPTESSDWELVSGGVSYKSNYSNNNTYYIGDIVNYGGNVYIALIETKGNVPTDTEFWNQYSTGFSYQGVWSSSTEYYIAQVVSYGGSLYQAIIDNSNTNPTDTDAWDKIVAGVKNLGNWETSTEYATDVIVTYGGNTFISLLPHASSDFNTDLAAGKWQKFNSGIRWRGSWASNIQYYKDDVVKAGSSSYIANVDTIGGDNPASGTNSNWSNFATGAEGFLSKDGDAMLGMLTLYADPTDVLHAATKSYVDRFINATDGGTVYGPLIFSGEDASLTMSGGASVTVNSGSVNLINGSHLHIDGASTMGAVTMSGNITVANGDIITTQTDIDLLNTNANTVNAFGAATDIQIGSSLGVTNINNNLDVDGDVNIDGGDLTVSSSTFNIANTNANTVNAFGAATSIIIGSNAGKTTIRNANTDISGVLDVLGGTTVTNATIEPTGFDNHHPLTRGIIEFSDDGEKIYKVDENGNSSTRTDGKFATGTSFETGAIAKTVAIYPASNQTKFIYWISGVRHEVNTLKYSTISGSIDGPHYFYFDGSSLVSSQTLSNQIISTKAQVANVFGSSINSKMNSFTDERHGITMDGVTQSYIHRTLGTRYESGLGLVFDGEGYEIYTNTKAGIIHNEDLSVDIPTQEGNKFLTRIGSEWKLSDYADNQFTCKLGVLDSTTVTNAGTGYSGLDTVITVDGDGFGAVAEPVFSGAPLKSVSLSNGGLNYPSSTTINITGDGSGAVATLTIPSGHNILDATITNAGSMYTNISGAITGDGTGATIALELDYGTPISFIEVTNLGSGYVESSTTATIHGDGTGATATVHVVAGAVTDVNIVNAGSGYTYATVVISGVGTGATATVHTQKSYISDYEITSVGHGYTSNATSISIAGDGYGATAELTVVAGGITDINITNPGYGYTHAEIVITGDGTGANANAILSGYPIKTATITNPGKNYTTANVVITGNGKNGAITANKMAGNTIDSVNLTNAGDDYTYATYTLENENSGYGASIDIKTTPSGILGINIIDGGKHYSYANIVANSPNGTGFESTTSLTPVPQYNSYDSDAKEYDLNNIPSGKYTITYFVTTPSVDYTVKIPSQYLFQYPEYAYQKIEEEARQISQFGLPYEEYVITGAVVIDDTGSIQTIQDTPDGDILYVDLTKANINSINTSDKIHVLPGHPDTPWNSVGKSLTIGQNGIDHKWLNATGVEHVFWVTPDGEDTELCGRSLATPFKTVKYACKQASLLPDATLKCINIKTGHFYEQLPIIVPPNCALYGDNQRTTTIHPLTGVDSDYRKITFNSLSGEFVINQTITGATSGATGKITHIENEAGRLWYLPLTGTFSATESISASSGSIHAKSATNTAIKNENCMMFRMSNGTLAQFMNLKGMTGWVPGSTPDDITTSEPKGIGFTLNPESPITTASPYILDSAVFFSGGIGAYVDGRAHTSGNLSMLFHAYTNLNDGGVGYWARWGGKLEQVSCFTYYCYFGYITSEGGNLRSLNGSQSWGTYGAYSIGYLPTETPKYGSIYGEMLTVDVFEGSWNVGDTITGGTSGAEGTVLNIQYSVGKLYYKITSGTFVKDELITSSSGGITHTLNNSDAVTGQKGALFIMTGFSELPIPGASIQMTGDTDAYVIQSVSGTYTDSSSNLIITLVQETADAYADGTTISIRYKYSQVRLTGHDFLNIGTGGITSTNLPNTPLQPPIPGNEVTEVFPGRVYYVSTDQSGNFRVGEFFSIDQGTGRATLNASAFDLSGLTSLRLGSIGAKLGEQINEFSSDVTMSGDSNTACPTEHAVKTYVGVVDETRKAYVDAADALKAPLASPALTGTPTAPTATANTNSTQIASTAFVKTESNALKTYILDSIGPTVATNITYNSSGYLSGFVDGINTYSNITYTTVGISVKEVKVSGYTVTSSSAGTKTTSIKYNDDGTINSIQ